MRYVWHTCPHSMWVGGCSTSRAGYLSKLVDSAASGKARVSAQHDIDRTARYK